VLESIVVQNIESASGRNNTDVGDSESERAEGKKVIKKSVSSVTGETA
jgi:hypothetical protein